MLPFKMRVYQTVAEAEKPMNADNIMEELEFEYKGEKQFNRKRIEHYLDAITAVGTVSYTHLDVYKRQLHDSSLVHLRQKHLTY